MALHRYRRPVIERVADHVLAGVLACALTGAALAYFGVLVP